MKHLKQSELAAYRKSHTPAKCPIFGCKPIPVLDHNHDTGYVRGVIDRDANQFEGKIAGAWKRYSTRAQVDLPTALRNMADYLEAEHTKILHPKGLVSLVKRFRNKPAHEQKHILHECGFEYDTVFNAKNSVDRSKLFRKYLTS